MPTLFTDIRYGIRMLWKSPGFTAVALITLALISSLLFGVHNGDPEVHALVAVVLLSVGTLAAFFPARRATKVDPLEALRYE